MSEVCTHLGEVKLLELPASVDGCEDCLRVGDKWLHLRICLTCGHVACCDDSPNRHATAHAHAMSHPIIRSLEPGEEWSWCYVDEVGFIVDGPRQDADPAVAAPDVAQHPLRDAGLETGDAHDYRCPRRGTWTIACPGLPSCGGR